MFTSNLQKKIVFSSSKKAVIVKLSELDQRNINLRPF